MCLATMLKLFGDRSIVGGAGLRHNYRESAVTRFSQLMLRLAEAGFTGSSYWRNSALSGSSVFLSAIRSGGILNLAALFGEAAHVTRNFLDPSNRIVYFAGLRRMRRRALLTLYRLPHYRVIYRIKTRIRYRLRKQRKLGAGGYFAKL